MKTFGAVLSDLQTDAIDHHRSLHDKHGLAGKRELQPEDEAKPGERCSLSVTSQSTRGGGGVSGSGHRLPAASARVWPDHICRLLEMEAAKPTSETRGSYRAEPLGIRGVRIGGPGTDGLPCAERGPGQGMVMASRSGLTDPWRPGPRGP